MASSTPPNPPEPPEAAGFLHHDASDEPVESTAADEVQNQRLESLQSSLIERIAAVDEERRRTATQMYRAIKTHKSETVDRDRRQRNLLLGVAAAMILLTVASVGYLQLQLGAKLQGLNEAMARLQNEIPAAETGFSVTPPATSPPPDLAVSVLQARTKEIGEQLSSLREQVARATNGMASVEAEVIAEATEAPILAATAGGEAPLETTAAPGARTGASPEPNTAGAGAAAQRTALENAAELALDAGEQAPEDAAAAAADAPGDIESDQVGLGAAAMLDSVIDRRWREVEREYQRLAVEVASPAVRAREGSAEDGSAGADTGADALSASDADSTAAQPASILVDFPGEVLAEPADDVSIAERPFALQLIGVFERERLDDFITSRPLPKQVYVREEVFRGRPWFVLFHSLHPDRTSAREALEALPPELAVLEPWIRELPEDAEIDVVPSEVAQR